MRLVLAIAVVFACPLAAAAQSAGDRYGPWSNARVESAATAAAGAAYQGRTLGWANKQIAGPKPQQAEIRPQPTAASNLPAAPGIYRAPPASTYVPFQPQVPLSMQQAALVAPVAPPVQPAAAQPRKALPTSIYGEAAPQAAPAPAAPPQKLAALAPTPTPARTVGGATRLYSVHRGYGLTPDAIPEPPAGNRYVLIGPPDGGGVEAKSNIEDDAPDNRPAAF
ncbi:hypothetical protein [Phenylobacterium sp. Root700]|uniref:hypothetical protein n=1 Tax=Phenylobacterium sp. Root700 TaxID=1736591 RepID=UPI000700C553|nr:hypothetical protein [Phenylobacterium sp. Root700]KRB48953.1 hypothetical protein ASE02_01255 [Phenylobacterium sp. Root700]